MSARRDAPDLQPKMHLHDTEDWGNAIAATDNCQGNNVQGSLVYAHLLMTTNSQDSGQACATWWIQRGMDCAVYTPIRGLCTAIPNIVTGPSSSRVHVSVLLTIETTHLSQTMIVKAKFVRRR